MSIEQQPLEEAPERLASHEVRAEDLRCAVCNGPSRYVRITAFGQATNGKNGTVSFEAEPLLVPVGYCEKHVPTSWGVGKISDPE